MPSALTPHLPLPQRRQHHAAVVEVQPSSSTSSLLPVLLAKISASTATALLLASELRWRTFRHRPTLHLQLLDHFLCGRQSCLNCMFVAGSPDDKVFTFPSSPARVLNDCGFTILQCRHCGTSCFFCQVIRGRRLLEVTNF